MQEKVLTVLIAGEDVAQPIRGRLVRNKWVLSHSDFSRCIWSRPDRYGSRQRRRSSLNLCAAGAQYGTRLLWVLLLLLPVTYFIQEMVVRLGIATGKGHASMIYERFGRWWGLFSLADLQLVNFLTLVTEFAAISLALSHMNIAPQIGVPIAAVALTLMALTGSYRRWESITVFLCLLDLAWVFLALKLRPSFGEIGHNTFVPGIPAGGLSSNLVFLIIAIVGTTIAPWQLFFQQSCIADKRLRFADVRWAQLDTLLGAVFTITVAACMMIAGNAAKVHGLTFPIQPKWRMICTYSPARQFGV